jgi:hypothetical protein
MQPRPRALAVPVAAAVLALTAGCGGSGSTGASVTSGPATADGSSAEPAAASPTGGEAPASQVAGNASNDGPAGPAPSTTDNVTMKKDPIHPCALVSEAQVEAMTKKTVRLVVRTYNNEGAASCQFLLAGEHNGEIQVGYEHPALTAAGLRELVEPFVKIDGGTLEPVAGLGAGAVIADGTAKEIWAFKGKRAFWVSYSSDPATDRQAGVALMKKVLASKAATKIKF